MFSTKDTEFLFLPGFSAISVSLWYGLIRLGDQILMADKSDYTKT